MTRRRRGRGVVGRGAILLAALAVALVLALGGGRATASAAPDADAGLAARVAAMRALVYDPAARFSRSATLRELRGLAGEAERRDPADALRDVLLMIGLVESKGGDPREVVAALTRGLAIPGRVPLPAERLAHDHYRLAEALEEGGDFARAADHFRAALRHMEEAPPGHFDEDERLGTGQRLGYVLHEAGRYRDALDANLAALAGGERLHGRDNPALRAVLTNIAQNLHELGRGAEAEPHLLRALALARARPDLVAEQDLLFQLGVLAYETGRPAEARARMRERVDRLRAAGRRDLLREARDDLAELERRLSSGGGRR